MEKNVTAKEFPSGHDIQELMVAIFGLLSGHFGGDATINQLRIGSYIGLKGLFEKEPTYNKEISQALNIPPSTVTRVVSELIAQGYVAEQVHLEDGRINLLTIDDDHPRAQGFESEILVLVMGLSLESAPLPKPINSGQ